MAFLDNFLYKIETILCVQSMLFLIFLIACLVIMNRIEGNERDGNERRDWKIGKK